jgi:hypothetical protein
MQIKVTLPGMRRPVAINMPSREAYDKFMESPDINMARLLADTSVQAYTFTDTIFEGMTPLEKAAILTMAAPYVGDAVGMAADAEMYIKDPDSRTWINGLLTVAGTAPGAMSASQLRALDKLRKNIDAWHGSPYNFDKFSMSEVGTGEGAQAYGHGLYFAGNRKV